MADHAAGRIVAYLLEELLPRWKDPGFPELPADLSAYNMYALDDAPVELLPSLAQLLEIGFGLGAGLGEGLTGLGADDPGEILEAVDRLDLAAAKAIAAMNAFYMRAQRLRAPRCAICEDEEGPFLTFPGSDVVICRLCLKELEQ